MMGYAFSTWLEKCPWVQTRPCESVRQSINAKDGKRETDKIRNERQRKKRRKEGEKDKGDGN